jgi:hypothetical protein
MWSVPGFGRATAMVGVAPAGSWVSEQGVSQTGNPRRSGLQGWLYGDWSEARSALRTPSNAT